MYDVKAHLECYFKAHYATNCSKPNYWK